MDFKHCVSKAVDEVVQRFIKDVSIQYNIEFKDLKDMWTSNDEDTKQTVPNTPDARKGQNTDNESAKSIDLVSLQKCTVPELKAMCKDRGLKCSGKKGDILSRLVNGDTPPPISKKPLPAKKKVDTQAVIKQLKANASSSLQLRRNAFGNYQHPHSDLIFNDQKKVYGVQKDDGSIEHLTEESIDLCNKYNFDYVMPDNLNTCDEDIDIEDFDSDEDTQINDSSEDSDLEDVDITEEILIEDDEDDDEIPIDDDDEY